MRSLLAALILSCLLLSPGPLRAQSSVKFWGKDSEGVPQYFVLDPPGAYYLQIITYCPEPFEYDRHAKEKAIARGEERGGVPVENAVGGFLTTESDFTPVGGRETPEQSITLEQRKAELAGHGCVDVSVEMSRLGRAMTQAAFIHHGGPELAFEWASSADSGFSNLKDWVVAIIQLQMYSEPPKGVASQ